MQQEVCASRNVGGIFSAPLRRVRCMKQKGEGGSAFLMVGQAAGPKDLRKLEGNRGSKHTITPNLS